MKDDFILPHGTTIIGAGIPQLSADTASILRLSNPNIYAARLDEPYRKGQQMLALSQSPLTREPFDMSDENNFAVKHHRTRSGQALIDIVSKRVSPVDGCSRWLLLEREGTLRSFAFCDCHPTGDGLDARRALCLADRVLGELRSAILTTSIRL